MFLPFYRLFIISSLIFYAIGYASEDISTTMVHTFLEHYQTLSLDDHVAQIEHGSLGDTYGNKVTLLLQTQYDDDIHNLGKVFITTLDKARLNLNNYSLESMEMAYAEIVSGTIKHLHAIIHHLYDALLPAYLDAGWANN